jgi:hypothetical protein
MEDANIHEDGKVVEVLSSEDSSQADSMDMHKLEVALTEWGDEEENNKLPSVEEMSLTQFILLKILCSSLI